MLWILWRYSRWLSLSRQPAILTFQYLNSALGDPSRICCHCLLQALAIHKVHVCEALSLIDLDARDSAEGLHSFFEKRLCDALRWVGMFDESLRCAVGWDRGWLRSAVEGGWSWLVQSRCCGRRYVVGGLRCVCRTSSRRGRT